MKNLMMALVASSLVTGVVIAEPAMASMEAGPFDKLKKAAKKVKKRAAEAEAVANEVDRAVESDGRSVVSGVMGASSPSRTGVGASADGSYCNANKGSNSNSPCTARAPGHVGVAGPAPAKYVGQVKCANLGLGNAFIGRGGNYTFSQGIATEERSGIIDRTNVSVSDGCMLPAMGAGDILYVEVDRSKYKKYDYAMQCVAYDGSEQLDNTNAPGLNRYGGKAVMLHTGHSLGYEPTASGSNSDRNSAFEEYMKGRNREMLNFIMPNLHTDKSGTDFFCQHFNKNTGESALAFTFRRGPTG